MRSAVASLTLAALFGVSVAQITIPDGVEIPDDIEIPSNLEDVEIPSGVAVPSGVEIPDNIDLSNLPSDLPSSVPSGLVVPSSSPTTPSGDESLPDLVSSMPECALPCLSNNADSAGCDAHDITCLCDNAENLQTSVGACLLLGSPCDSEEAANAGPVVQEICRRVGNNPDAAELSSATSILGQAIETGSASSSNNDDEDEDAAATVGVGAGLLISLLTVAMAL